MADWQFKLDLKDVWRKSEDDEIDIVELSRVVVERIKALIVEIRDRHAKAEDVVDKIITKSYPRMAQELEQDVLALFEEIVETKDGDVDIFDNAMESLYDWADTPLDEGWNGRKMCWVSTTI